MQLSSLAQDENVAGKHSRWPWSQAGEIHARKGSEDAERSP